MSSLHPGFQQPVAWGLPEPDVRFSSCSEAPFSASLISF